MDKILGIYGQQRISLGAAAKILEETVLSSYAKGGKAASFADAANKQAVKELVHGKVIDFAKPELEEKKKLRYLHIVADKDHVSAQFWNVKGNLKTNTIISKIIVVYEDVINESGEQSENPRYRPVGKKTFSGVYKGETENYRFWEKVRDYIEKTYDIDVLEKLYIAGDGGTWIKVGTEIIENSRFVLDKFHIMKYINTSVARFLDSADDVKSEIWECVNGADKKGLKEVYQRLLEVTEHENKYKEVKGALNYLLNHWSDIKIRVEEPGGGWKCCAEGQVSHILSSRMSSRPMGWSEWGCHQMSQLRAYHENGGNNN